MIVNQTANEWEKRISNLGCLTPEFLFTWFVSHIQNGWTPELIELKGLLNSSTYTIQKNLHILSMSFDGYLQKPP